MSPQNLSADPLRCVRAFRLAAELGFEIEPTTLGWIRTAAPEIRRVAGERVWAEMSRLLSLDGAAGALREMDAAGLLVELLPESRDARGVRQGGHHHLDVWGHSLATVAEMEAIIRAPEQSFPRSAGAIRQYLDAPQVRAGLALAALLHDLGKPVSRSVDAQGRPWFRGHEESGARMAAVVAERWRLPRRTTELLERLIRRHLRPLNLVDMAIHVATQRSQPAAEALTLNAIRRMMRDVRPHGVGLLMLALADLRACRGPTTDPVQRERAAELLDNMLERYCRWVSEQAVEPLLTGRDLIAELGLAPGPRFGEILDRIEDARADGLITTRQEALALARRLVSGEQ